MSLENAPVRSGSLRELIIKSGAWEPEGADREIGVFTSAVSIDGKKVEARFFTGHRDVEAHSLTTLETYMLTEQARLVADSYNLGRCQVFATYNKDDYSTAVAVATFADNEDMRDLEDVYSVVAGRVRNEMLDSRKEVNGYESRLVEITTEIAERVDNDEDELSKLLMADVRRAFDPSKLRDIEDGLEDQDFDQFDYDAGDIKDGARFIGCALVMRYSDVIEESAGIGVRNEARSKSVYARMVDFLAEKSAENMGGESGATACLIIDTTSGYGYITEYEGEHPGGLEGAFEHAVLETLSDQFSSHRKVEMVRMIPKHMKFFRTKKRVFG